jgi:hypothetical protein
LGASSAAAAPLEYIILEKVIIGSNLQWLQQLLLGLEQRHHQLI